jgi:hypothetical protein
MKHGKTHIILMVNIRQNDTSGDHSNHCIFTLMEKATLADPTFIFKFTNDFSGQSKVFTATDISSSPSRYSEFILQAIKTSQTEDLHNGKVKLFPTGFWSYQIGEAHKVSPPSINWNDVITIVEVGRAFINNTDEDNVTTFAGGTKDQTIYFTP